MKTKIVAKRKDGRLLKGTTGNFLPYRNIFHISPDESPETTAEVLTDDLKAVFFVKDLEGSRTPHNRPPEYSAPDKTIEKEISVTFRDNEVINGFTHSFHLDRLGFFIRPADPNDNNERIFVVLSSVKTIMFDNKLIDIGTVFQTERTCEACGKKLELSWKFCPYDGTRAR